MTNHQERKIKIDNNNTIVDIDDDDDDLPMNIFSKKHRFKDTLALFVVFLSFNHFSSLCFLIFFVIATRFNDFIPNFFISLFLTKKPSPCITEIAHFDKVEQQNLLLLPAQSRNNNPSKRSQFRNTTNGNILSSIASNTIPAINNNNSTSSSNANITNNNGNTNAAQQSFNTLSYRQIPISFLLCEILVATLLRVYGGNYFISPIENLAISLFVSFLINDPNDCLSYATSCTVIYAVSINLFNRIGPLFGNFKDGLLLSSHIYLSGNSSSFKHVSSSKFPFIVGHVYRFFIPSFPVMYERYIHHLRYYLSFHIVVHQFGASIINPSNPISGKAQYMQPEPIQTKIVSPPSKTENNSTNKTNTSVSNKIASSTNTNSIMTANIPNQVDNSTTPESNFSSSMPGVNPFPHSSFNSDDVYLQQLQNRSPYFTDVVSSVKSFEPSTPYTEKNNIQTVNASATIDANFSKTNISRDLDTVQDESLTNQLYEISLDMSNSSLVSNLKTDVNITSNLENFIRFLFKRRNLCKIPPLWSMFVTMKTTNFEKKYLHESDKNVLPENEVASATTEGNILLDSKKSRSVFNNNEPLSSMALVAQTTSDDYDQLNLISTNNNIFNKRENDYKVCITDIGTHSLTFHIENLHDGELIVLVNGLIWSEVSCALVLEQEGEEYAVVSGLVPSCSYDIQFINRLNQTDDYLISDLIVRTKSLSSNDSEQDDQNKEISEKFEKLDFSFPSYYHRKFLSPLLTLKHSVLTTNANLTDERTKLKKTKKEITKKLNSLRQEIDHFKNKIKQNASADEKNSFKVDNLKIALQQNENALNKLENDMKEVTAQEAALEEEYLKKKDNHLKKQLEFSKFEETLKQQLNRVKEKEEKLTSEYKQLSGKREKLSVRHNKLQKELDQNTEILENFKNQFISRKEKERSKREEMRIREINELELNIKGLEQDINRLEAENANLNSIMHNY